MITNSQMMYYINNLTCNAVEMPEKNQIGFDQREQGRFGYFLAYKCSTFSIIVTSNADTKGWRRTSSDGRTSSSYDWNKDLKLVVFLYTSLSVLYLLGYQQLSPQLTIIRPHSILEIEIYQLWVPL